MHHIILWLITWIYFRIRQLLLLRIQHTADDEAGRYEGIPLAFMSYAQRRVEWLVLAIPLAKRSQTLSCSGIIRTWCRCLKYYLTERTRLPQLTAPAGWIWILFHYWSMGSSLHLLYMYILTELNRRRDAGGKIWPSIRLLAERKPVFHV